MARGRRGRGRGRGTPTKAAEPEAEENGDTSAECSQEEPMQYEVKDEVKDEVTPAPETTDANPPAEAASESAESKPEPVKKIPEEIPEDCSAAVRLLMGHGISKKVSEEVDTILIQSSVVTLEELDEGVFSALKGFPEHSITDSLQEFAESDFSSVTVEKKVHLASILNALKESEGGQDADGSDQAGQAAVPYGGPSEAKIKELLERTGYKHEVTPGQRHYGPPPDTEESGIAKQAEVFVGKIPRDVFEDDLVPLFEQCGKIYDLRIMIDPQTGMNRGFAFVNYTTKEAATAAVEKLNDHEIRPGKNIKVNVSTPNLRLFIGNIPKNKNREELLSEFSKLTESLVDAIVYTVTGDPRKKNRGFCFLEYDTHLSAAAARRKLSRPGMKIFNCEILADWADPVEEPDEETMSKVKVLYVKNLTAEATEEMLREEFGKHGTVERVKKVKDYGFIHFEDRESALKAMDALNNEELGGSKIEITLARPVSEKTKQRKEERKYGGGGSWGGTWSGAGAGLRTGGHRGGGGGGWSGGGGGWGGGGGNMRGGYGGGGGWGGGPMRGGYGGGGSWNGGGGWGPPGGWGGGPGPMMGPMRGGYGGGGYGGQGFGNQGFGRGGGQGFGGPRGGMMGPRGGFGGGFGGPRGGGGRGGFRGGRGRGGPRGRGRGGGGPPGGMKRKADEGSNGNDNGQGLGDAKAAKVEGNWSEPIPQQPLEGGAAEKPKDEWSQDSFAGGWS